MELYSHHFRLRSTINDVFHSLSDTETLRKPLRKEKKRNKKDKNIINQTKRNDFTLRYVSEPFLVESVWRYAQSELVREMQSDTIFQMLNVVGYNLLIYSSGMYSIRHQWRRNDKNNNNNNNSNDYRMPSITCAQSKREKPLFSRSAFLCTINVTKRIV